MVTSLYEQQQRSSVDINSAPQEIEGQALIQIAGRLTKALENAEGEPEYLKEQVRLNWRVWTIIQSYLVDKDCELPDEIRDNLLSLTRFIDQQTVDFLAKGDTAKLPSLININRQIGAGLLSDGSKKVVAVSDLSEGNIVNDNAESVVGDKASVIGESGLKKVSVTRIQGRVGTEK